MQHDNAANCLADELLGLLQRVEAQLPRMADERNAALYKDVINPMIEVIDRRLPSGPDCTCPREDTK